MKRTDWKCDFVDRRLRFLVWWLVNLVPRNTQWDKLWNIPQVGSNHRPLGGQPNKLSFCASEMPYFKRPSHSDIWIKVLRWAIVSSFHWHKFKRPKQYFCVHHKMNPYNSCSCYLSAFIYFSYQTVGWLCKRHYFLRLAGNWGNWLITNTSSFSVLCLNE